MLFVPTTRRAARLHTHIIILAPSPYLSIYKIELPTQKSKPSRNREASKPARSQPKAARGSHNGSSSSSSSPAMAAAALTQVGTGGGAATSRFAAACGALRQYVKAAEAERMHARPAAVPVRPLPLMPGADVSEASPDGIDLAQAAPAPAPAQMTIVYGGRVLVLDDIPADKAAGLLRLAAGTAAAQEGTGTVEQRRPPVPSAAGRSPCPTCKWRGRRRCNGSWRSARSGSPRAWSRTDGRTPPTPALTTSSSRSDSCSRSVSLYACSF